MAGEQVTNGRRRALTIHNGTRLTPTLVRMLGVLADDVEEIAAEHGDLWRRADERDRHTPVIVARSDGLAVYVNDDRARRLL